MFVYIQTEKQLWTVGFYKPDGMFSIQSDHDTEKAAIDTVHYLNGGSSLAIAQLKLAVERISGKLG